MVDAENRIRFREVSLIRSDRDSVTVSGSLADGEKVCVSALDIATDGMTVQVVDADNEKTAYVQNSEVK